MCHYNASMNQPTKESAKDTQHKPEQEITVTPVVYTIQGHNGIILDTFQHQTKAVKEFILGYKGRAKYYSIWQCLNGIKTQLHPTGSMADYSRA